RWEGGGWWGRGRTAPDRCGGLPPPGAANLALPGLALIHPDQFPPALAWHGGGQRACAATAVIGRGRQNHAPASLGCPSLPAGPPAAMLRDPLPAAVALRPLGRCISELVYCSQTT